MERSELPAVWAKTVDEQVQYLHGYQARVAFYTGTLSAILGGTVALAFRADSRAQWGLLVAAPLLPLAIAQNAKGATGRIYRLHLEAITQRLKLQDLLGMHAPVAGAPPGWIGQSIVPQRHLDLWAGGPDAFVFAAVEQGFHSHVVNVFRGLQVLGGVGAAALLWLALRWP